MSTILDACPKGTVTFQISSKIIRISGSEKEINAFHDCSTTLQNFVFEDSSEPELEIIDNFAFYKCSVLQKIDLTPCKKLKSIGDYSFSECTQVSSILLPEFLISIGVYCFSDIKGITEFTLPKSVETIQSHIFYNCASLKTFNIEQNSQLTRMTRWMIGYTLVETITVPKTVSYIDSSAFETSLYLKTINVEEGNKNYVDDNGVLYYS